MNEQLAIYLWSISTHIVGLLCVVGIILSGIFFVMGLGLALEDIKGKKAKQVLALLIIGALLCFGISSLVPSKEDLALIFLYPKVKQGTIEVVQSAPAQKMVEVLNLYLDKQIKELKNDK